MSEALRKQPPAGWALSTLGAIQMDLATGVNPSRTPEALFELYSVPSHEAGKPELIKGKDIGSNKQAIEPDTVLLCKINPRINRVWVTGSHSEHPTIASTEWIPFFRLSAIEPRYLAYFLMQGAVRDFLSRNASGVGGSLMRVRAATFRDYGFPLAPTPEQSRIADALDELFSDLDAGVAALNQVREKLKLYRVSVLKAAVEGTLTAEWRAAHPNAEPASELLKRILVERRRRWEEDQLAKFKEKAKAPPKNWKTKYKEPAVPDTRNLPPLPEGWCWTTLDAVITEGPQNGLYVPKTAYGRGVPILRIDDFQNGWVRSMTDLKKVAADLNLKSLFSVHQGDLLINRVNSMTHLGKCLAVSTQIEGALFESNIMRARLANAFETKFAELYLWSELGRRRLTKDAKWAVNQASINQQDVIRVPIPLPSHSEQTVIVELVEDQLSVIDHLEGELHAKLSEAQSLRQSILRHAFTGQLVPQDPKDEPASELLRRIAAEREARLREAAAAKKNGRKDETKKPGRGRRKKKEKGS